MDTVKPKPADPKASDAATPPSPAAATPASAAAPDSAAAPGAPAAPGAAAAAAPAQADTSGAEMVEVLARLMIVAAVYPPGHPRIATIVDPVLAVVRATAR